MYISIVVLFGSIALNRSAFSYQDATGVELSIPMPGHTVTNETKISQDVDQLRELIASHDVIYLLMDSRESCLVPKCESWS